jgi:hypothetical protein
MSNRSGANDMLNTKAMIKTNTEINLGKSKVWNIEGDRRGDVITCLNGMIWITQQSDLKDYVLHAGEDFWVTKSGVVIVQALENAQFKYSLNELQSHVENNTQPILQAFKPRPSNR